MAVAVGAPRVVGIAYPGNMPFGRPGDADGQRAVLGASLEAAAGMTEPGTRVDLPFESPPGARARGPAEPPPITRLIYRKPWLYIQFLKGHIPNPTSP